MNKELNFTKAKKTFLTVTLPDDKKILVRNPTKRIMDVLQELGEDFTELQETELQETELQETEGESEDNFEVINRIYASCAEIMSNNIAREPITVDYLSDLLDVEDIIVFFDAYTSFVGSLTDNVKN